jgi:NAD(P) transhydrogenase
VVDEHYRTSVPHIYAAGDVIGAPALASTSLQQARAAVSHAFGLRTALSPANLLPTGIYTIPEISSAGETEQSLRRNNIPYVVGRVAYPENARGDIIGDQAGFLKLLFRKADMKLVGVHVLGEQATELVHIGLIGLLAGADAAMFEAACYNVPTLGDLYRVAAMRARLEGAT